MYALIESLLKDPMLARRVASLNSAADAAAAFVEAAAARGLRLGHDAVGALLDSATAQPRELTGAELLAVSGGTRSRTTLRPIDAIEDEFEPQMF